MVVQFRFDEAGLRVDDGMRSTKHVSDKEMMSDRLAVNAASVPVDLGMSDAKLGSIFRGLLAKLAKSQAVTVVPQEGSLPVSDDVQAAAHAGKISRQMAAHIKSGRRSPGQSVSVRLRMAGFEARITSQPEPSDLTDASIADDFTGDALDQAVLAAEARGQVAAKLHLDSEEMLVTADVAARVGISRQAVAKRRDSGTILALKAGPKALKYPDWQILPTGEVVPGIEDVLRRLEGDAWTAYRLLKETAPDGSDRPLYELLRDGDTETVLAHIDGILGGAGT
ncbi:MAG: hypothetical protein AAFW87_11885 [Pseudomonadota bacterium]